MTSSINESNGRSTNTGNTPPNNNSLTNISPASISNFQSPNFISPSSTVPSSPTNDGIPTSTCSTPSGSKDRKSKDMSSDISSGSYKSSKDGRNRSQSEADKLDEKHSKKKPFLSPKMLLPGKGKNSTVGEEPPISKTLDSRMKSNPYIKKFKLPSSEILVNDYSSALMRQLLLHGRLYLFTNYICFESKIFGIKTTEVIQIQNITSIAKKRPVAIEIIVSHNQKFVFASFVSRDKTFHDLMNSWREVTGESHEDVSSHSIDDDMDEDINSFEESTNNINAISPKSSVISDSLLLSIETQSNYSDDSTLINTDEKKDNNVNGNNIKDKSNNSNNENNKIDSNIKLIPENVESSNIKSNEVLNNNNNNNNNSNNSNNSNNINNNHVEKSPFDELYGSIEQYLSTNEQSSILESSVSEFQELLSENFNISVANFFRALCSDQCNFAHTYHAKRGDSSIIVKNWAHRERFGTVRELEYVAPVNSPIGPDKTRIQETQRYHLTHKKLSIETDTIMLDIPYGDHFRIEAKWDVVETSAETCRLTIQICVRFIKKTWFKSKIETTTIKESKGSFSQWVQLAKQEIQMLQLKKPANPQPQQPHLLQAPTHIPSLNKSTDKRELHDLSRVKNEEGISSQSDSPKPHHVRSRSRQHLVSSSGQINITPVLNQPLIEKMESISNNSNSINTSSNNLPIYSSSGLKPPTPTHSTTPSISPFATQNHNNNNNNHHHHQQHNHHHNTPTTHLNSKDNQFNLSFNSKYGGITLSGVALFSIILICISLYFYMYMKIISLNSKLETIETILRDVIQVSANQKHK